MFSLPASILKLLVKFSWFKSVPTYPKLCVVKKKETYSGTGYEDGQYPFVLYNCMVLRHETKMKLLIFVF